MTPTASSNDSKTWRRAASSPVALGLLTMPTKFRPAGHLRLLNRKLLQLARRKIRRLAVQWPPRHAKSTNASHHFPFWYLGRFPTHRVGLATYSDHFGASWGRRVRESVRLYGGPLWGLQLQPDNKSANEWELTAGGGMFSGGPGSGWTGKGFDLMIYDDLVKNAEEALSPTVRQNHKDFIESVADTRLEPDAIQLAIGTRWHSDDAIAFLIESWKSDGLPYEVLTLPALALEDDPLGRRPGEALWPERFGRDMLEAKQRRSPYWFPALFQQTPVPMGGALFKSEWFTPDRGYDEFGVGDGYRLRRTGRVVLNTDLVVFVVVDPSVGKNERADDCAIGVFGVVAGTGEVLVLHVVSERIPLEQIPGRVVSVADAWSAEFVACEANGFQLAVATSIRERFSGPVRELEPHGKSKLARATRAIEMGCAGTLVLPADPGRAPWVPAWVAEHCAWTAADGDRDNRVDTTAYACRIAAQYNVSGDDDGPVSFGAWKRD